LMLKTFFILFIFIEKKLNKNKQKCVENIFI